MAKFKVGDLIEIDPVSVRKEHHDPDIYIPKRIGMVLEIIKLKERSYLEDIGKIVKIPDAKYTYFKLGKEYTFDPIFWKLVEDEFDDLDRSLDI